MTSGNDFRTANPRLGREVTEEVISNSAQIPQQKSGINEVNPTRHSGVKPYIGQGEFILMKEERVDGLTAGGWRSMDERKKNLFAWVITVFVVLIIASVGLLFLALCWWGIYFALHSMF